jgi:hypothetical protein
MYEVEDDTYCYPGTTVLKNKLGLKNQDELAAFEAEITAQRASEPLPPGDLSYELRRFWQQTRCVLLRGSKCTSRQNLQGCY